MQALQSALVSVVAVGVLATAGCSPGYVARAAYEEAKILQDRRPIDEVIHDTATASNVRQKLRLVRDARYFAVHDLGLDAGKSFESYATVDRDTLLMVVSAAPPYRLAWKTWWFPIVGRIPYRGYFDPRQASDLASKLGEDGYDVYVRPSTAFSTLGWLPDPLLSSMLRSDSVSLVETVIHEITHTTYFPRGEVQFNESFANFVGHRGAIEFFCVVAVEPELCDAATARWHDSRILGRFYRSVYESLGALYADSAGGGPLSEDSLAAGKRAILERAVQHFADEVRPQLLAGDYGVPDPDQLNNAWLLARVLYYERLGDFEAVYERFGSLAPAIEAIIGEAKAGSPWEAIDRLTGVSTE
jgi:predicted aminopeptidase